MTQLRSFALRPIHSCSTRLGPVSQSASEKLFADAAREEAEENNEASATEGQSSRLAELESRHRNWTGEESVQDAVLRMLVDKYKPHRSHWPIRTADQKLKESPPQIRGSDDVSTLPTPATRSWQEIADVPLLPSIEGHRPWHTTFKPPSQMAASIKLGNFAPSSSRSSAGPDESYERTKRTERELAKRKQQAYRLSDARESTLDYQLGLREGTGGGRTSSRINPVSLKGWQSLIEERIEKARLSGQFDKVEGRGQPLARLGVDRNPFIAREEFFMNRIVLRNGAAPPWVEVQMELEASVNAFRETLRDSWTRRATRMLAIAQPPLLVVPLSSSTLTSLRDQEWEERERSFHDAAIAELNSLVRKYNAMAPYAARRAYYSRDTELARAYRDSGEEILRRFKERSESPSHSGAEESTDGPQGALMFPSLWHLVLQWMRALSRRFTKAG